MKKLLLSLALMVQVGFAMANDKAKITVVQVRNDNVKMFQQAGTATPIMETISTTDRVEFLRKFNKNWALVLVNDKVGYVLLSELTNLKVNSQPRALATR